MNNEMASQQSIEELITEIRTRAADWQALAETIEIAEPAKQKGYFSLLAGISWRVLLQIKAEILVEHVEYAYKAWETLPWANQIDHEMFLKYVLQHRILNEPVKRWRKDLYNAIYPRVCNLSSLDKAIIEANRWASEKAGYEARTGRSYSPLELIREKHGLCTDLTILCVAACRSVGIPARPIYAPCVGGGVPGMRTHSWTEVWNGRWHYIGSCEAVDRLDRSWFTLQVKSVAKVYTMDFEKPDGKSGTFRHAGLGLKDLTSRYTKVGTLRVRITDGIQVVPNCNIDFSVLYPSDNIWYPVASALTDEQGVVEMVLGAKAGDYKVTTGNYGKNCEQFVRVSSNEIKEIELRVS